jgi:hypothetical protein
MDAVERHALATDDERKRSVGAAALPLRARLGSASGLEHPSRGRLVGRQWERS